MSEIRDEAWCEEFRKSVGDYKHVKIGVYAIAANEPEGFIDRWLDSMQYADYIWVLITKLNDPNYAYFLQKKEDPRFKDKLFVEEKEIKPWRFDVARNESIAIIDPSLVDALICTDIDEVLDEDFWDDYRQCVFEHPDFHRIYYRYAWSHTMDGTPDRVFWYDKTHAPTGWRWVHPVHEALDRIEAPEDTHKCYRLFADKIYLHHYPDGTKSRGSYLSLLELRQQETPDDLDGHFYLIREYGFHKEYDKGIRAGFDLYVKLSKLLAANPSDPNGWLMSPLCGAIGSQFSGMGLTWEAEKWFKESVAREGSLREGYINLAQRQVWNGKPDEAEQTLADMEKSNLPHEDWRENPTAWRTWRLEQIRADICMWRQDYDGAAQHMNLALEDIKDDRDKLLADEQGFYADLHFLRERLINLIKE